MKKKSYWETNAQLPLIGKIIRIMKLSVLLIFFTVFNVHASVYSQATVLKGSINQKSVREILKNIEEQSKFRFFYNDDFKTLNEVASVNAEGKKVNEVLSELFDKKDITYKILENNVIVITPSSTSQVQDNFKITGKITDIISGETLPGVSIVVEGTTTGTISDMNGKYTIEVPNNGTLVFSFIGYSTYKQQIITQEVLDVTLVPEIQQLQEMVVIGYGSVKKRDLTGAVASVKSDELTKSPTSNALEAIQGKVAGVDIVRSSGSAGSGVDIRIRGTRTFDQAGVGSNDPLFIIDGVQGASYADINPSDIESMDILKDASSTAIYGYQGAGGVIIITTKKASAGKTKISYNGYYGINGFTAYPKGRMGEDYLNLRREANKSTGTWSSTADDSKIFSTNEWKAIQNNQWVDWNNELINDGSVQNHQLSISSGNEKTKSYFSGGYFKEVDAVKADFTRYSGQVNVDHTLNEWLKASMLSQITYSNQNKVTDPLTKAMTTVPLGTAYDADGNINPYPLTDNTILSPLTDLRPNAHVDNVRGTKVFTSGSLELTPIKGLSIKTNLGVNLAYSREGIFNDTASIAKASTNVNEASITNTNSRNINWDNVITYNKSIDEHTFGITALTSYTANKNEMTYVSGTGQAITAQSFNNLAATTSTSRNILSSYSEKTTFSYASRLNYGFKERYFLTASVRLDGVSCLADKHKWSSFPSVATAWRISDEDFVKDNVNAISNIKLRASYGVSGNSSINPYTTQSALVSSVSTISFGETAASGYSFNQFMGNSDLSWERSGTLNIGLDWGFLNERISATMDWYNTQTTGVIYLRSLPVSDGGMAGSSTTFNTYQNAGKTRNRGFEFSLNSVNIQSNDFKWISSFTFYKNNEKIVSLVEGKDIINGTENSLLIGHPVNSFYTYKKLGIWQTGEEEEMAKYKNSTPFTAGSIKLADTNGDLTINTSDQTYIGSAVPKWESGLQNTFNYKGFDLNIYLFMRWGQTINNEILGRYNPLGTGNGPAYLNYWTSTNASNDFPKPGNKLDSYLGYQSLVYVDGSYFKVKNVSLGYTLPKKISKKVLLEKFRVYVTASNLLTLAKSSLVKYYDPENGGSASSPMSKQIIVGVNAEF